MTFSYDSSRAPRARALAALATLAFATMTISAAVTAQTPARAGGASGVAPVGAAPRDTIPAPIVGFSTNAARAQWQLEAAAAASALPARAKALSRELSKMPHMSGTPGQMRTRDLVADALKALGIETRVDTYNVYLPHPTSVRLFRLSPDSTELAIDEGIIPEDSTSGAYPQIIPFNAYGAAGDVTGDVIYVNYGLVEDYQVLESMGVSVLGKIVVARYGRSYRGVKAREAEKHGAAALIIYSDPADDGYMRGDVYPEGPMRPGHGVQRGSVYNDNGDPTTPNYPSLPGATRLPLEQTTIPRIPVIPVASSVAAQLLQGVRGHPLPDGWQGGLPFRYHVGPGSVRARIVVETDAKTQPYKDIWNVMGTIRGNEYPDQIIVIGGHRDAWGPGAADNVSGTVSILETARAISEMVKLGYRPKRTIVFASWDGEEWGLLGSTEYVEQDTARLSKYGVAYLNQDMVAFGPTMAASGSPSLRPLFRDVARRVANPDGRGSVYDAWRRAQRLAPDDTTQPTLGDPGGGSDFAGFYNHLGVPMIEWGFGGPQGIYHSAYDSFHWVSKFGDPTFVYHSTTSLLGTLAVLRLANADILPYDYVEYARAMRVQADTATAHIVARGWTNVSTQALVEAIGRMEASARAFAAARDAALAKSLSPQKLKQANELLISVERAFVRPEGLHNRSWFRNVIYAADDDNGYDNITLPTINEAVRAGDQGRAVREIADLVQRFDTAATLLDQTARSLR